LRSFLSPEADFGKEAIIAEKSRQIAVEGNYAAVKD
jgi:hypothetical protein